MFKDILKKSDVIVALYSNISKSRNRILTLISPVFATKYFYKKAFKRPLNLDNPQTLNEKILWLKLNTYKNNDLVTQCADKYRVRDYVRSVGCHEILNELINVWDSVEDINWETLPKKFVIKANHGAGYNFICKNKDKVNMRKFKRKLKKWLNEDFWKLYAEINYKHIPKKLTCEKFIETDKESGLLPEDYKIYCFNGVPKFVMLCVDREKGQPKFYYFNREWDMMPYSKDAIEDPYKIIDKPEGIDKMFDYAEKMSKPFPFVRVDFYLVSGEIIFGELTFTPSGGLDINRLPETDYILGEMLELPK